MINKITIKKTVILLLSIIVFFACKQKEQNKDTEEPQFVLVAEGDSTKLVMSRNGKAKNIVQTAKFKEFEKRDAKTNRVISKYMDFPQGIYVESYNDKDSLESTIKANYARHDELPQDIWFAADSVEVKNITRSQMLCTDTIYWDASGHTIYNNCFTRIYFAQGRFDALNGLTSDETFFNYKIRTIRDGDIKVTGNNLKSDSTANDTTKNKPQPVIMQSEKTKEENI